MPDLQSLIAKRNKKGKNAIVVFVGGTGEGKSWAGLRLAETTDKNFSLDKVAFEIGGVLKIISEGTYGSILWDDTGVGLGAREYNSLINRMFSRVGQSFRFKVQNLYFTVPTLGMIDKNARLLSHYVVDMKDWGVGVLYETRIFRLTNFAFFKKLGTYKTKTPDRDLAAAYEKKKEQFMNTEYKNLLNYIHKLKKEKRI